MAPEDMIIPRIGPIVKPIREQEEGTRTREKIFFNPKVEICDVALAEDLALFEATSQLSFVIEANNKRIKRKKKKQQEKVK